MDDLIKALGCDHLPGSRICEQLDEVVDSFLGRPLDGGPYPYVWLGLTQKVSGFVNLRWWRRGSMPKGSVRSTWAPARTAPSGWPSMLADRSGPQRGGTGYLRCSPGAEERHRRGVHGASWQRCRTHFMANLLTRVPKRAQPGVATMVRTIYQHCLPPRSTAN